MRADMLCAHACTCVLYIYVYPHLREECGRQVLYIKMDVHHTRICASCKTLVDVCAHCTWVRHTCLCICGTHGHPWGPDAFCPYCHSCGRLWAVPDLPRVYCSPSPVRAWVHSRGLCHTAAPAVWPRAPWSGPGCLLICTHPLLWQRPSNLQVEVMALSLPEKLEEDRRLRQSRPGLGRIPRVWTQQSPTCKFRAI